MMTNSLIERFRPHLWSVLLLLAATFAVYGRILGHDFLLVWDDNFYVTDNPDAWGFTLEHLRGAFSRYYIGNYAPVQILSYMLDYEIWGLNPGGFLFTNIVIHAVSGLLVYRLSWRWYGDRLFSLVASALFLLHPVQVESVAWISQRKNLLAMLFFLLAWEGYCRYRESARGGGWLAYAASVAAFVLSLLAKSMTVVFPVVLVLYDFSFPGGGRRLRLKDKIPYLLAAGIIAALAVYSEKPEIGGGGRTTFHGGSPWATFLTMLPVFCRYLGMLIWPVGLSAEYAPTIHQAPDVAILVAALLLAGLAFGSVRLYRRDRRLGFWVLFFWVGLLPVSQVVPMLSLINDRYLYLPMVGVAPLAGCGVLWLRERFGARRPAPLYVLIGLILLLLGGVSRERAGVWRDSITLMSDAVAKAPGSFRNWALLADAYNLSGDSRAARQVYERALEHNPVNPRALNELGKLYTQAGEPDKGQTLLIKLLKAYPDHAAGWVSLGDNALKRGDYAQAEKAYRQAVTLQPEALQVKILLGNLEVVRGRFDQARDYYGEVEVKGRDNPESAYRLACLESLAGRRDEAFTWLEKALRRGYRHYDALYDNVELSGLWVDPRFNYLLLQYFPEQGGPPPK